MKKFSTLSFKSLLSLLGDTPLLEIPYKKNKRVKIFAKCEWFNPSGSVKDRAAANILLAALKKGHLENKVLLDATSGNTGISYAMFAASLGIPLTLTLPENASFERKMLLKQYGAKVVFTSALEGTDGAQAKVAQMLEAEPDKYYCPDQYNNPANWQAHFNNTGPEIWKQTDKKVNYFIAGLGTTGTFLGTSRYLKEKKVSCIEVQPDNPMHGLEGWKHLETALLPGIYDDTVANNRIFVSTEQSYLYAKAAFSYLGLALSPSSAANLLAAMQLANELDKGTIVTIFADNAMKYLKDEFWNDGDTLTQNPFY